MKGKLLGCKTIALWELQFRLNATPQQCLEAAPLSSSSKLDSRPRFFPLASGLTRVSEEETRRSRTASLLLHLTVQKKRVVAAIRPHAAALQAVKMRRRLKARLTNCGITAALKTSEDQKSAGVARDDLTADSALRKKRSCESGPIKGPHIFTVCNHE